MTLAGVSNFREVKWRESRREVSEFLKVKSRICEWN